MPSCLQVAILPAIFRQVASKLPPRWPQEASRWQLGPTWPHPGLPLSAKNIRKTMVFVCFCYFTASRLNMPKMAQRWPQECPRRPQDGPKSRQVGPKTAPRRVQDGLKTALWWLKFAKLPPSCLQVAILPAMLRQAASKLPPSCLQDGPKRPQEVPRRSPRGPQQAPRVLQEAPKRPSRGPQEALKRPQEPVQRPPRGPEEAT